MNGCGPWEVGEVRARTIVERVMEAPALDFLPEATAETLDRNRDWLGPWALGDGDELRFAIQAVCLEADGAKVVVDTCIGQRQLPGVYAGVSDDGSFLTALENAGFGRDDVDLVVCTHLHFDHVGWNTVQEAGRWVPTFRKARYIVAEAEYEHWEATSAEERASFNVLNLQDTVAALFEAGVVDLVDSQYRVSDAITLLPTPGHTPGHVSVHISSHGATALVTGDCAHHPVQLAEPGWYAFADTDPATSSATRRRLIEEYADTDTLVIGTHFQSPTAGKLVRTEHGVRFRVASE